ncbi:MAG TPA: tripartite tricarboxylate transporter substrate binding protein [Burkholderiales bacterium]|nr:tripartite tricarboxylate transporter substrate binding protein [Burkholderiales bacterium]
MTISAAASAATADPYPVRPVRLIVPFAPGGPVDALARILAPQLHAAFGQSVVVDNRPGASGLIGIESGIRATPDGYTITMVSSSYGASAATLKLPYHPVNDVAPIVLLNTAPQLAVVHPSVPIKTVPELIAYAKANPGKLNYGSSGTGGSVHLSTEFLSLMAGIRMTHVPYKGQGPALNDIMAGQIHLMLGSPTVIYTHVKAGRLRGLAMSGGKRSPAMPDIPTFLETVPGYETYSWQALLGPKALPKHLIMRWNTEINRILQTPEMKARAAADGVNIEGGGPERFFNILKSDLAKWAKVVASGNVKTGG